jgi:DNA mismatch repair protein MutH
METMMTTREGTMISKGLLVLRCWVLILVASALVLACGTKISQENFDKIKTNMTLEEVKSILGEPTETSSVSVAGLSGTQSVWKHKDATITIQFVNNMVGMKNFSKGR